MASLTINTGPIDQDAEAMVKDAEAALAEVNSGVVAQGYYTCVVILMDEDRKTVQDCARRVEKAINATGFIACIEAINTLDAYLGRLPGHGVENVRHPLINTMNLADLIPTSTIWTGRNTAPCPKYPPLSPALMHFDDFGHAVMFGRTGRAKSPALALIRLHLPHTVIGNIRGRIMKKYILFLNFILLTACTQELPEPKKVTVNQVAGNNALTQSPTPVPVPTIPEANDENCKFEYIKSITDKYVQQSLADNCAKRSPKVKATKHKPWVF